MKMASAFISSRKDFFIDVAWIYHFSAASVCLQNPELVVKKKTQILTKVRWMAFVSYGKINKSMDFFLKNDKMNK